jgi:hypothetical protein
VFMRHLVLFFCVHDCLVCIPEPVGSKAGLDGCFYIKCGALNLSRKAFCANSSLLASKTKGCQHHLSAMGDIPIRTETVSTEFMSAVLC